MSVSWAREMCIRDRCCPSCATGTRRSARPPSSWLKRCMRPTKVWDARRACMWPVRDRSAPACPRASNTHLTAGSRDCVSAGDGPPLLSRQSTVG
eukprot:2389529-Prymnesium_polylepis.1